MTRQCKAPTQTESEPLKVSCTTGSASGGTDLADVDAGRLLPLCVSVAELSHRGDWVEAGVLRQCRGDDLQGVGVCAHTVGLHARQGAGVLSQPQCQLDLRGTASSDQGSGEQVNANSLVINQSISETIKRPN